jgi:hypothetical protein
MINDQYRITARYVKWYADVMSPFVGFLREGDIATVTEIRDGTFYFSADDRTIGFSLDKKNVESLLDKVKAPAPLSPKL